MKITKHTVWNPWKEPNAQFRTHEKNQTHSLEPMKITKHTVWNPCKEPNSQVGTQEKNQAHSLEPMQRLNTQFGTHEKNQTHSLEPTKRTKHTVWNPQKEPNTLFGTHEKNQTMLDCRDRSTLTSTGPTGRDGRPRTTPSALVSHSPLSLLNTSLRMSNKYTPLSCLLMIFFFGRLTYISRCPAALSAWQWAQSSAHIGQLWSCE